ncbi:MAG: hypothetical protein ACYTGV_19965 [Planctomycetota bacterium]|jgi:hypothetical protein
MQALVDAVPASPGARERTKVILETLAQSCSVQAGCRRLGIARTRFQDLRRCLIQAAVEAVQERAVGRPRKPVRSLGRSRTLRERIVRLERELAKTRAELDIARSPAGPAVAARLWAQEWRR